MHYIVKYIKSTNSDPTILILDGDYSYIRYIDLTDLAKYLILICVLSISTRKLQPLDEGFMSPFKTYYASEVEQWLRDNQLSILSPHVVAGLIANAYKRISMEISARSKFRKTRIISCNRNVSRDHDVPYHNSSTLFTMSIQGETWMRWHLSLEMMENIWRIIRPILKNVRYCLYHTWCSNQRK